MPSRQPDRRSYGQYCGLARALDAIGDRWTLLIVRELLIGPRRFGELQAGLPGIATNLLADRLRQLEQNGLVSRSLGEPRAGIRYTLSPRGEELRAGIEALIRWSAPLMVSGREGQVVRASWLAVALPALLLARPRQRVQILVTACGEDLLLSGGPKGISVTFGKADPLDAVIVAEPEVILGLASGAIDLRSARRLGATVKGDVSAIGRIFESRAVTPRAATNPGATQRLAPPGRTRRKGSARSG